MKKISLIFLVLLLIGVIVACTKVGNSKDENDNEVVAKENEEVEEDALEFKYLNPDDIQAKDAMTLIETLSSEKFKGRQAGTDENEEAEDLLVEAFKALGLESVTADSPFKQVYTQLAALPVIATEIAVIGSDVSYKYQIDFTERFQIGKTYYDADIKAKMVLVNSTKQLTDDYEQLDKKVLLMTQSIYYSADTWTHLDALLDEGIEIEAIIVASDTPEVGMRVARGVSNYDDSEFEINDPVFISASTKMFVELKNQSDKGAEITIKMDYEVIESEVANIVGVIQGKHEKGEDETLIIGAHMDHVGNNMDGSFNAGALDNASGVSVVMELARLLMKGEKPEDTIVFVLFNGEEDGLLGSKYFVENPPVSYVNDNTKMLNLDMVGSINEVPLLLSTMDENSEELADTFADLSKALDIKHQMASFGSSDHVNFAQHGIESIMLIHLDYAYYHTYMDTVKNSMSEERLREVIELSLAFVDQEVYE